MSGGHFDYLQSRIGVVAENVAEEAEHWDGKTKKRILLTAATMRLAAVMLQRVDWLISADDGEESFHLRWEEEVDDGRGRKCGVCKR